MNHTVSAVVVTLALATSLGGCREENKEPLTTGEAVQALDEMAMSAQASSVMTGSIEITTDFTIGGAVEAAAQEIRNYVASQLPCAELTLTNNTLEIEYGVKPGNCTYRGHEYSGSHTITVERNDMGEVIVDHTWDNLSNGVVSVSGDATVTWNFDDVTRHVQHELTWTRLADGRTGIGTGDITQRALSGGITEGFSVDGEHAWEGEKGRWELGVDNVEMRWIDPVPQAGTYTVVTPNNKSLSMSFERVDADSIRVIIENGKNSFSLVINSFGAITEDNS